MNIILIMIISIPLLVIGIITTIWIVMPETKEVHFSYKNIFFQTNIAIKKNDNSNIDGNSAQTKNSKHR